MFTCFCHWNVCMDFNFVYLVFLTFVRDGNSSLVLQLKTSHNKGDQGKLWESNALYNSSGICQCIFCQKLIGEGQRWREISYITSFSLTLIKYFPKPSKMLIIPLLMKPLYLWCSHCLQVQASKEVQNRDLNPKTCNGCLL